MNRIAASVALAAFASPALAQNLAISFQPTGEPNTYDMVAELFGPLPVQDDFDDIASIWASVHVRYEGDGPITVLEWNPAFDVLGPPDVTANATSLVEFVGFQFSCFIGADPSNPLTVLRFRYDGTPSAFAAEMIGQNAIVFCTPPRGSTYLYTSVDGPSDPLILFTHSFGPLPGVDCTPDINGDGALSPGDFNAWILAFNNQSAGCDQNGDGACTPGDFNAWILNYNAGC